MKETADAGRVLFSYDNTSQLRQHIEESLVSVTTSSLTEVRIGHGLTSL